MILKIINCFFYGTIFLSLFLIDYVLGNGFVEGFQTVVCKIVCVVRKTIREQSKQVVVENPVDFSMLLTELVLLSFTVVCLNKYKQYRGKDRLDELLQESKDALKETNDLLEKWRLRRVPSPYTYLDEEPQEIKPLTLEVPILHMAIIDTLGTTRSQPERGDAGDAINITDSTLLSVTSLLDDGATATDENAEKNSSLNVNSAYNNVNNNNGNVDFNSRHLWNVLEEDANILDQY